MRLLVRAPVASPQGGASRASAGPVVPSSAVQASGRTGPGTGVEASVAVLLLVDYAPGARLWGWMRLVLGRWPLRHVPGLAFSKVLGSGHDGGFGLRPSASRQGLFLVFEDEAAARRCIDDSELVRAYRRHAREFCVALLRPTSCKGSWSGVALRPAGSLAPGQPMAALTRASIRASRLADFWRLSPPSEASLAAAPGCTLAVGLGEAPLVRQCTFSVWESVAAMDAYARSGAHQEAIRTSYAGDFFSESMFVRFSLLELRGIWKGQRHAT